MSLSHERTAHATAGFYPMCLDGEDAFIAALRSEKLLNTSADMCDVLAPMTAGNGKVG